MRIIIIPEDGFVSVDGVGFSGLDLSFMDSTIHAVQWYGDDGEVERKDERGRAIENESISEIKTFQNAIDKWQEEKLRQEAAEAEEKLRQEAAKTEENETKDQVESEVNT